MITARRTKWTLQRSRARPARRRLQRGGFAQRVLQSVVAVALLTMLLVAVLGRSSSNPASASQPQHHRGRRRPIPTRPSETGHAADGDDGDDGVSAANQAVARIRAGISATATAAERARTLSELRTIATQERKAAGRPGAGSGSMPGSAGHAGRPTQAQPPADAAGVATAIRLVSAWFRSSAFTVPECTYAVPGIRRLEVSGCGRCRRWGGGRGWGCGGGEADRPTVCLGCDDRWQRRLRRRTPHSSAKQKSV